MFDENKEEKETGDPVKEGAYIAPSNIRTVCFIPKEGKAAFLNYAYLVSCEYDFKEGKMIELYFTTHKITLEGYGLEPAFWALMLHTPRIIQCTEERYIEIMADGEFAITGITIISN